MNQKIKLLLAILALAVILGGASLLYPRLASLYETPQGFTPVQATEPVAAAPTDLVTDAPATVSVAQKPSETPTIDVTASPTATPKATESVTADLTAAPTADVYIAPDFEVLDAEGNPVHLTDFRGKPVIMNFWATWCPPCKLELPDFDHLAQEYADDIVFLMINLTDGGRDTIEGVQAFMAEMGYTFPVYYDTEYSASMAYGASSIPMTVLVDPQGALVGYAIGALSEPILRQAITERLGITK